jgi:phage protein D
MSSRDERFDTLTPAFKLRVNGAELPQEAVADVMAVGVLDDVDAASMCTLQLKGWDGVAMKVKWMDGELVGLEPDFPEGSPPTLTVRGYDLRHRLMRERRTHSYLQAKDSDVAVQIAQAASLRMRADDSGVVFPYLLQHNQTDYQFLAARAARIGWELMADGTSLVFRPRPSADAPALTLRRETDLLNLRMRLSSMGQAAEREVRGWSPKDKQAVTAQASVSDQGPLMGGTASGAATANRAFQRGRAVVVNRPLQGQEEADQLARRGIREMGLGYIQAEGTSIGEPLLRAGIVVKFEGLGERFSGHYYVGRAEHRFSCQGGYQTRFSARRNAS